MLQNFTSLPGQVAEPLNQMAQAPAGGQTATEFRRLMEEMQRIRVRGVDQPSQSPNAAPRALLGQIEALNEEIHQNLSRQADGLAQLVQAMAGLPGRRAVLYLGGRSPTRAGRALIDAWQNAFGRSSDYYERVFASGGGVSSGAAELQATAGLFDGLAAGTAQLDTHQLWLDVAELASDRGVVLHSIDVGALRGSSAFMGFANDPADRSQGNAGNPMHEIDRALWEPRTLKALSEASGGQVAYGHRDFLGALANIGSDLQHFYSLGFVPPQTDGKVHRLKVRLRDGQYTVRHRQLYRLKTPDDETLELLRSALWLDETFNPLAVEVNAGEILRLNKKKVRLPLAVTVPLSSLALVAEGAHHVGQLSIFVAGSPEDGKARARKAVVPVRIPNAELLTALGRKVEYTFDLELDAPPQPIAVVVRDDLRPLNSTAIHRPGRAIAVEAMSSRP